MFDHLQTRAFEEKNFQTVTILAVCKTVIEKNKNVFLFTIRAGESFKNATNDLLADKKDLKVKVDDKFDEPLTPPEDLLESADSGEDTIPNW